MPTTALPTDPAIVARQRWMGVLARGADELKRQAATLRATDYRLIRAPEVGMTLVRGRMGGTGDAFNLGEMSVTRCVVRLADGCTGYSYVAGRDKQHAELAALADAHLQGERQAHWLAQLIEPMAQAQRTARAAEAARTASTQVEFFTLIRGED